jgi:hypothetical protein
VLVDVATVIVLENVGKPVVGLNPTDRPAAGEMAADKVTL